MHIAMNIGGLPFDGDTIPNGEGLGGSESAGYYLARALAARGHDVSVFVSKPNVQMVRDRVKYYSAGDVSDQFPLGFIWHNVVQAPHDALIVQRHPFAFSHPANGKAHIWWLHDLALARFKDEITASLFNTDKVAAVSMFHAEQINEIYGIGLEHIAVTPNGVDYDAFPKTPPEREPRSFLFAARPERGLENYLTIAERMPDCTFYVCGYENTTPQMARYYSYLYQKADGLPNVKRLGALGKKQLYDLMARVQAYLMPTDFEETFCTLAAEAQAAGTPVIACDVGAVGDTIRGGAGVLIDLLPGGGVNIDKFVVECGGLLHDLTNDAENIRGACKNVWYDWAVIAEQWEKLIIDTIQAKQTGATTMARHLERMSDIVALNRMFFNDADAIEKVIPGYKTNYSFFLSGDYKGHYDRYYEYEKARGVNYGPENLDGNRRFETIANLIVQAKPKTVLDYGCAHGHYVMNLANRMPGVHFTGVDINQRNIDIAHMWACDCPGIKASWIRGTHEKITGTYDVIIAAEVLEHVPDPAAIIERLKRHLTPGGMMLISTPYGPWEAIGYEEHKGWRAHIHHFERQDLFEMLGKQKDYRLYAVPHAGDLGHFIVTIGAGPEPVGVIDYERKLSMQAPGQTISLCMIAKDEQHNIGKMIESMRPHVDEIVIGVDRTTTDKTREVIEQYEGVRWFEIESPLAQGFAEARNRTVEAAKCDWILWLDCDETMDGSERLRRYCKHNVFYGYAIKQHHIAAQPAGILKTDLPVRLFRNVNGIKFHGLVHEHPERSVNEGVGKACLLPDISIIHSGYRNEMIRRARFMRNYPLMVREMVEGEGRVLSRFLFARDMALMNQYEVERGLVTDQIAARSEAIVEIWRDLVSENLRMAVECLEYYSSATRVLKGARGLDYSFAFGLKSRNGTDPAGIKGDPIHGCFMSTDDINLLTQAMINDQAAVYGKYF